MHALTRPAPFSASACLNGSATWKFLDRR